MLAWLNHDLCCFLYLVISYYYYYYYYSYDISNVEGRDTAQRPSTHAAENGHGVAGNIDDVPSLEVWI